MKLTFVEMSGFRGFRHQIRVEFGPGFSVICGRNGVGRGTLCDAIEFALTGTIDKYRVEKAANENLSDYVWWRGDELAQSYFVRVGFADGTGIERIVTRSREQGSDTDEAALRVMLCQGDAIPDNALTQMMRTSLIRDELIAALSLDLTEIERFELVRAALGAVGGPDYAEKGGQIANAVEASLRRSTTVYDAAREALNEANGQLSVARDSARRTGDVSAALEVLGNSETNTVPTFTLAQRITVARATLAQDRQRLSGYGEAASELIQLNAYREEIGAGTIAHRIDEARRGLQEAEARYVEAQISLANAEQRLAVEREADAIASALASLIDHGEHLGLDAGHCPLCAAARSREEFGAGLARARARLATMGSRLEEASAALTAAQNVRQTADNERQARRNDLLGLEGRLASLRDREKRHIELFDRYGLDHALAGDVAALEKRIEAERSRLLDFERAILTLDASVAVQQVETLEQKVKQLRAEVDRAADDQSLHQNAVAKAKALERGVKLAAGELVDERLSAISPLLNELYQRLRPHTEWKHIQYAVRGQVRRFLSLRVGNNLNPQFVFSSGQRRTAGLAFLLSVHLARTWCLWETLVLDDPVQHIDDYRALNLVEVLAAIRRSGRQVICAVEDQALADLLCRRLASSVADGTRIDLKLQGRDIVPDQRIVAPLQPSVLRQISVSRVAS